MQTQTRGPKPSFSFAALANGVLSANEAKPTPVKAVRKQTPRAVWFDLAIQHGATEAQANADADKYIAAYKAARKPAVKAEAVAPRITKYSLLKAALADGNMHTRAELMQASGYDAKNLNVALSTFRKEGATVSYDKPTQSFVQAI